MNQSNFNIGQVLKVDLEKELPSVTFENIWSKYSEHKKPYITFKRMAILVAAILLVVVSKKYINSIVSSPNTKGIVSKIEVKGSANDVRVDKNDLLKSSRITAKTNEKASKTNESTAVAEKSVKPTLFAKFSLATQPLEALVKWNNNVYKKTMTTVSLKELGEKLGKVNQKTEKTQIIWEEDSSTLGTDLYTIKGEDSKKVIAIKIEGVYYRAIKTEVKK